MARPAGQGGRETGHCRGRIACALESPFESQATRCAAAHAELACRHDELIAVGVEHDDEGAPILLHRRAFELYAARAEFVVGALHVVALEGDCSEGADAVLVPIRA